MRDLAYWRAELKTAFKARRSWHWRRYCWMCLYKIRQLQNEQMENRAEEHRWYLGMEVPKSSGQVCV